MSIINRAWNHYDETINATVATSRNRTLIKSGVNGDGTWDNFIGLVYDILQKQGTNLRSSSGGFDNGLQCNFKVAGENEGSSPFCIPSLNVQLCAMVDYKKWGQQSVVVGPQMQEAFADTELGKVPPNHLKFPFPAYWIAIPDNTEIVCWGGTPGQKVGEPHIYGTGFHAVKGAYVISRDDGLLIHMWAPDPEDPTIRQRLLDEHNVVHTQGNDWAHTWFTFKFSEGKDIEETLREQFDNKDNEIHDPNPFNPGTNFWADDMSINSGDDIAKRVAESSVRLLRIIINSALYMTSPKADIDKIGSTKRAKLLNEAEDLDELASRTSGRVSRGHRRQADTKRRKASRHRPPVIWIGPNIERKLRAASEGGRSEHSKRKGHVRKGHWHMFRTGRMKDDHGMKIANELRAFIYHWIPPTWCGDLETSHESQTHAFREV